MIKYIIPVIIMYVIFWKLGPTWGFLGIAVYLFATVLLKLPEYIMMTGGIKYKKDPEKAFKIMERALKTGRLKQDYVLYLGYLYMREGQFENAERVLGRADENKMIKDVRLRFRLNQAMLLWKKGDLNSAIALMEEAHENEPSSAVYGYLGYFYIQKGDLLKALEYNKEAYMFDKYDEAIADNLALNYRLLGDLEASLKIYEELTDKRLGMPIPYYNYGETLYELGRKEDALEMMDKALSYNITALAAVSKSQIRYRADEISRELGISQDSEEEKD